METMAEYNISLAKENASLKDELKQADALREIRDGQLEELKKRVEELELHETETHHKMGMILGTDDSMEELAKLLLQRAEQSEKRVEELEKDLENKWAVIRGMKQTMDYESDKRRELTERAEQAEKRVEELETQQRQLEEHHE